MLYLTKNIALRNLYIFVLRTGQVATFDTVFRTLQYFAIKLCIFTYFGVVSTGC